MDYEPVLQQVLEIIEPVITPLGLELIEQEILPAGRWVIRLYIERIDGSPVSIDDCTTVSRAIEAPLEVADVIPHSYTLEISSPGIDRPLRRPKDFERFAGNRVRVKTKIDIEGRKNFTGQLKGLREEAIVLSIEDEEFLIPLTALEKARLQPTPQGGK